MDELLTLSRWLSPAFPVSAYAYSHGLEAAVTAGEVRSAETLARWIGDVVEFGAGRADAVLLSAALRGEDPEALAATARALAGSRERLEETEALGRAFAATLAAAGEGAVPGAPYPVALGVAARPLGLPAATVAGLYLQAFAGALVGAGQRLIPVGQAAGQAVLAGLQPAIARIAASAAETPVEAIASAVPGADLAAMAHETQEVRLFRT